MGRVCRENRPLAELVTHQIRDEWRGPVRKGPVDAIDHAPEVRAGRFLEARVVQVADLRVDPQGLDEVQRTDFGDRLVRVTGGAPQSNRVGAHVGNLRQVPIDAVPQLLGEAPRGLGIPWEMAGIAGYVYNPPDFEGLPVLQDVVSPGRERAARRLERFAPTLPNRQIRLTRLGQEHTRRAAAGRRVLGPGEFGARRGYAHKEEGDAQESAGRRPHSPITHHSARPR